MSALESPPQKITYTSAAADLSAFHRAFDEALLAWRARLGETHPILVEGRGLRSSAPPLVDTSPIDTARVLARFESATPAHVEEAVRSARSAQPAWGRLPFAERLDVLRRAARAIRRRKFEIAALMSLEVGKSRLEAMGDAEEAADLVDYYAGELEAARGFVRPLGRLSPNENTLSVLRPYGVFACIAPFNFPMALSTGMSAAALLAGNAVVYKPSQEAPFTGLMLAEAYGEAGLPKGLFSYLPGRAAEVGDALWSHPGVDGVVFTGSKEVGMRMLRGLPKNFAKPALLELGGKNPTYVSASADLDKAASGVVRSAFSLQGQKCSACSRVYVHEEVYDLFADKLLAGTRALVRGDPSERDVFFGPVVNARAVATFEQAVRSAREAGRILEGGERLRGGLFDRGHFVAPTVVELPLAHEIFLRELFVPLLAVGRVKGLEEALAESNKADYGLTAGIFSEDRQEVLKFFEGIEAGVCYANRSSGATTGAWPGVQSFCGWKGSGSTGKGACGPYYVMQFMREQSRTIME
ncbi:MAG TPA: aldehyde dehydrogenase family protein [Anaeromyxobacteraceae bacterium]|nr:aldehyde dehydrogenase family protein [Anaeromyxobacteraceae bacterium]